MPDHRNIDRPEWQALWQQYEPVTTPLRAAGLPCDIDTCGGQTVIYVDLPDGTHLVIADEDALPNLLEHVTGWNIQRNHRDNPTFFEPAFFDSMPGGEHEKHGADIVPMLAAVAHHLKSLTDPNTQAAGTKLGEILLANAQRFTVNVLGVTAQHAAHGQVTSGPFSSHEAAVSVHSWQTHLLEESGWQQVHTQGDPDWPLTVWHRHGVLAVVFVGRLPLL
ncbi:hypothetical protein [Streptomyces sp. NPDC059378]|uniref:hypothetical protein n=1 Tax=Streptomyces sp. NPDC059378 TaxID=3346815 RepID=UPI0036B354B2